MLTLTALTFIRTRACCLAFKATIFIFVAFSFSTIAFDEAATAKAATAKNVAEPKDVVVESEDVVEVIQVSGHFDGIIADSIEQAIANATIRPHLALVMQVDSPRSTISDERLARLASSIANSQVPVTMWVGPSGAQAFGAAGQLAGLVSDVALAHGSELGNLGASATTQSYWSERFMAVQDQIVDSTISSDQAIALGLAREAPTLPFFVLDLPGFRTEIDTSGDEPVRVPVSQVRFVKLSQVNQFMHTVSSPPVAYLLLIFGAVLFSIELYTAGIGISGVSGAFCFMLGCYGIASQPVRVWALILLAIAAIGYCIDTQVGMPRVWTVVATTCLVIGSLALFEGTSVGWVTLITGIVGVATCMTVALPAMTRSRFSLPTIGREWMIGAIGTADAPMNPEGVVNIDGTPWLARTNRATPVAKGETVEVVSIDGLTLNVAPAHAATKDAPQAC